MFELEQIGSEKFLRLVTELSKLPLDFGEYVRANRNVQEVLCDTSISVDDMRVYLFPTEKYIQTNRPFRLFAKVSCANWTQGSGYRLTDWVVRAEHISA